MPFVRRRPLLRAAAVGGVAYMGAKAGTNRAMAQKQGGQPAAQPASGPGPGPRPPAPVAAAPGEDDTITRLQETRRPARLGCADRRGVRRGQGPGPAPEPIAPGQAPKRPGSG